MIKLFFSAWLVLLFSFSLSVKAQQKSTQMQSPVTEKAVDSGVQTTLAYAEVTAQKVEAEAEIKILIVDFTDNAPQVRAKKLERDLLLNEIKWLESLPAASQAKLTLALGRLVVRKVQTEVDLRMLLDNYAPEHPLVKKARTRLEVYASEIQKLLQ